jgi:membrane fusion protein, heavy metal efflux system
MKLRALIIIILVIYCKKKNIATVEKLEFPPVILESGKLIKFPKDSPQLQLFQTKSVAFLNYDLSINAPGTVIGKVVKPGNAGSPPVVLFASSELTAAYSGYVQDSKQIAFARSNYNRTKDLYEHGASTGKELNDASSELYNKQALLAEHESALRKDGFNPSEIYKAKAGSVWIISDLPETELNVLLEGTPCKITFPSYPSETFDGKIEAIAEVLNMETRKARIRIQMIDKDKKIRPGMYGKIEFIVPDNGLMIPKQALFSANARYYIFIKKSENIFERREVTISSEKDGLIEIAGGVQESEEVVITNVYLLKGLSFGI